MNSEHECGYARECVEYGLANFTCKKCGHVWVPRIPNPQMCPKCKTYTWKKDRDREGDRENE